MLEAGGCLDAIFAANDFAAIGAMGVLRERGISVPDDVAVVGYNDTSLAAELPIPLTTNRSPMHEVGRRRLVCSWPGSAARRSSRCGWRPS